MLADSLGRAIAFALALGQADELPHADPLLDRLPRVPGWVVADRGYSSHAFREHVRDLGGPSRDPDQAERGVSCLSRLDLRSPQPGRAPVGTAQGVASRRQAIRETARSFMGALCLAATCDWIKCYRT